MGGPRYAVAACAFSWLVVVACSTGDRRVDPADLELRDLLGVAPEVATTWDADQRAAAHALLIGGLREDVAVAVHAPLRVSDPVDDTVASALGALDADRFAAGTDALGLMRVTPATDLLLVARPAAFALATPSGRGDPAGGGTSGGSAGASGGGTSGGGVRDVVAGVELRFADRWQTQPTWGGLALRGHDLLAALARDAGYAGGPVIVVPAPRLAVIASYVASSPPHLLVNPVLLAALEPVPGEATFSVVAAGTAPRAQSAPPTTAPPQTSAGGNPYSFFGSVAECAAAERTRCETCLAASNCAPETNSTDGNAECTQLGANGGRGYYLMCINLSLAITAVDHCTTSAAPQCPADPHAATSLGTLEQNAGFLTDATCADALDTCLAKIYGPPKNDFPSADAGVTPTEPPRSTNVDCGNACSSNNNNCSASPNCDCSGPSCNNSLSCDSGCSSSNNQSGCGGNCDSCQSSGGGTSSGGTCSSGGSSGNSGCTSCSNSSSSSSSGCSGCSSGSGGGGSCGSSGGSSSSSGCGGGSGGGCGGGSGGSCGGGSGNSCGGGGGGSKCSVAQAEPGAQMALAMSVVWGFLPVPFAAAIRRRSKRKRATSAADAAGIDGAGIDGARNNAPVDEAGIDAVAGGEEVPS